MAGNWGGRRLGAGRPAKTVRERWLTGNAGRRSLALAPVDPGPPGAAEGDGAPEWQPSPASVRALGAVGRELVATVLAQHVLDDAIDGVVLLELAHGVDRLAELRAVDRAALPPAKAAALDTTIRRQSSQVAMLARTMMAARRP